MSKIMNYPIPMVFIILIFVMQYSHTDAQSSTICQTIQHFGLDGDDNVNQEAFISFEFNRQSLQQIITLSTSDMNAVAPHITIGSIIESEDMESGVFLPEQFEEDFKPFVSEYLQFDKIDSEFNLEIQNQGEGLFILGAFEGDRFTPTRNGGIFVSPDNSIIDNDAILDWFNSDFKESNTIMLPQLEQSFEVIQQLSTLSQVSPNSLVVTQGVNDLDVILRSNQLTLNLDSNYDNSDHLPPIADLFEGGLPAELSSLFQILDDDTLTAIESCEDSFPKYASLESHYCVTGPSDLCTKYGLLKKDNDKSKEDILETLEKSLGRYREDPEDPLSKQQCFFIWLGVELYGVYDANSRIIKFDYINNIDIPVTELEAINAKCISFEITTPEI